MLDLITFIFSFLFMPIVFVGMSFAYRSLSNPSMSSITKAIRAYSIATIDGVIALGLHIVDIREDGVIWSLIWVVNIIVGIVLVRATMHTRKLHGERVMREAQAYLNEASPSQ